jgi:hypothetical protein
MKRERRSRMLYRSRKDNGGCGWSFTRRPPGHPRLATDDDGYSRGVMTTRSPVVQSGTCEVVVARAGFFWQNQLWAGH